MTSKKEIENECNQDIQRLQKQLSELEEQHKGFLAEDKQDEERKNNERKLSLQLENLEKGQYKGNFGDRDNWYYSRIPKEFLFDEQDKDEIKKALNELKDEKLKEIKKSEEYKKVSSEREKVIWDKFSPKHREIHDKIDDIKRSIEWKENRIRRVQTKGGLIEVCKWIAENKRRDEAEKIKKEKIKKYKDMIKNAK